MEHGSDESACCMHVQFKVQEQFFPTCPMNSYRSIYTVPLIAKVFRSIPQLYDVLVIRQNTKKYSKKNLLKSIKSAIPDHPPVKAQYQ